MSIFPTKILLATDGSEEAELAAATAADLAKSTGSELDVIYVLDVEPWRFPPDERGNKRLEELKERGRKLLDEQVELAVVLGGCAFPSWMPLIGRGLPVSGSRTRVHSAAKVASSFAPVQPIGSNRMVLVLRIPTRSACGRLPTPC